LNTGHKQDLNGDLKTVKGKARVVDSATNAKLKVSFFWPFAGDYWILELGRDYEYAVVGDESRKYLWILSRTAQMDDAVYNGLLERARDRGFDISKLEKVPQKHA
jgi:apolipoprotein D and lipocalin family protein